MCSGTIYGGLAELARDGGENERLRCDCCDRLFWMADLEAKGGLLLCEHCRTFPEFQAGASGPRP